MSIKTRRGRSKGLGRMVFRLIAIMPLGLGLPACTSSHTAEVRTGAPSPAAVYASDDMLAWEERAPADFERFEFARNDAILGDQPVVAIRATNQWPQPLDPIERPVQFELFQQNRGRSGFFYGYDGDRYDGRYRGNRGYRRGNDRGYDRGSRRWGGPYNRRPRR